MDDFDFRVGRQGALVRNNIAVSLIASGRIDQAIEMLVSALAIYRRLILLSSKDGKNSVCGGVESRSISAHDDADYSSLTLDQPLTEGMGDQKASTWQVFIDSESEGFDFVYTRGIHIAASECRIQDHSSNYGEGSAAAIFNLALAHHLSASIRPIKSITKIAKALKLYTLALEMQGRELTEHNALVALASLNNMGVIQNQISESKRDAIRCFESLFALLLAFPGNLQKLQEGHLEGFFRNAMNVLIGPSSFAPAA